MNSFNCGVNRIKIIDTKHPMYGQGGTIWRLRFSDDQAWVTMDNELPEELQNF